MGLTLSCSFFTTEKAKEKRAIVDLTYDLSSANISKETLESQFKGFEDDTFFRVTLKNFDQEKQNISQVGYKNIGKINNDVFWEGLTWPGQKGKINIKEWILNIYSLTVYA